MFDVDAVDLQARAALHARVGQLVAEACAWSVGLSDRPHYVRRGGRVVESGLTLGALAANGQPLADESEGRLELGDARPASFQDALNALAADGRVYADAFEEQVLATFVLQTCLVAVEEVRRADPAAWQELLDDLGEDGSDLPAVVRAAEWEAPLRIEAEQLLLAALAHVPLVEAEAEGLPLSLVRAAEAATQAAAPVVAAEPIRSEEELAGALFLADAALRAAGLPAPVPPDYALDVLTLLLAEDLEPREVVAVLPQLPLMQDTVEDVAALAESLLEPP